jgi:hypothetical protein
VSPYVYGELVAFLGEEPHTPLDRALSETLTGLGCQPARSECAPRDVRVLSA